MRPVWRTLACLIATALATYFVWFFAQSIDLSLFRALMSPLILGAIVVAAILYSLVIPLTGWAWARLLRAQGEEWRVPWLTALLAVTQLAKYIPGNVAQHAGRAMLAMGKGMTGKAFSITVVQEALLASAASVGVGIFMLMLSAPDWARLPINSRAILLWTSPAFVLAVVLLSTVRLPPEKLAASPSSAMRLLGRLGGLPGARVALPVLTAYISNYLIIGLGLWLLVRAAGLPIALSWPLVTASFALAWLLGFLAPGAPAGLGVREGIMVTLLSGVAADEQLLAFVLLARVVTVLGDAIAFASGTLWLALRGNE